MRHSGDQDYLAAAAHRRLDGRAWEAVVAVGEPGASIVHTAMDREVDLIVMAVHARTGVERLFEGSIALHVLRHAGVPVLVLRRGVVSHMEDGVMQATGEVVHASSSDSRPRGAHLLL